MKKGKLILVGLLFGIFLISFVNADNCFGDPNPEGWIEICSCEDLQEINSNLGGNYVLMNDIDCSGTTSWNGGNGFIPIGTNYPNGFSGHLNGNGHNVSDLYMGGSYVYSGFIGYFSHGSIEKIGLINIDFATTPIGEFTSTGGLIGYAQGGKIIESYVTGNIRDGCGFECGGFAGWIQVGTEINDSYSRVEIIEDPTSSQGHGGFVGMIQSWNPPRATNKITNSYSTGIVSPNRRFSSGFSNQWLADIEYRNNFWDKETSGLSVVEHLPEGVRGKSTAEMTTQETFEDAGWDFTNVWAIDPTGIYNNGYPYLQWENAVSCPPETCTSLGKVCGIWPDGCNGFTQYCGPCNPGWDCPDGICIELTPTSNICLGGENDRIMKLFSEENSHGALWNDTHGYDWEICYPDIFIFPYTGSDPHPLTCLNPVLWLSSTYNAHASISEDSIYTIPVCYGDLDCVEDSSTGDICVDTNREVVVRLSDVTNAHISSESDSDFPIKICCKEIPSCIPDCTVIECGPDPVCGVECGPCDTGAGEVCDLGTGTCVPSIGVPYWADMNGDMINQSDLNDLVKLIAQGLGLPGKEINYSIYIKNALVFDWLWPDYKIFTASSEEEFTTWRAGKNKDEDLAEGEYYFEINIGGIIQSTKDNSNSDYHFLTVSDTENNNPPVANITSPKRGEVYLQENNVSFNQTSYDIDDYINYTWNLDDGIEIKGSTKDNPPSNYSFNYTYDSSGKKDISLNVLDERGLTDRDLVSILILDEGDYIFADIKEPELEAVFENKLVNFNASYTYAININRTNGLNITCLGGSCPATTANGTVIDLNGMVGNYSALNFSWVFSNGETHIYSGSDGVQFKKRFENADEYTADLTVNLLSNHSVISNAQTKFRIRLRSECTDNGEKFWDAEGESHDTLIEAGIWCVGVDGVPWDGVSGINDDCCPTDLFCNESALNHGCQDNPEIETWCKLNNINRCEDYPDEDNCTSDFCSKGGSAACGSLTICNGNVLGFLSECNVQCEWNGTRCRQVDNIILTTTLAGESESVSKCVYGVSRGDCNEDMGTMWVDQSGDMEWNQTALDKVKVYLISERGLIGANDNDARVFLDTECNINSICISEEGYRICGARLRKLGFFGGIHLIIALFAISIIYYFWILKDKSKKNRK